eukprot:820628_1
MPQTALCNPECVVKETAMGYVFEDPKENIDIRSYYKYAKPTPNNKLVMETYEDPNTDMRSYYKYAYRPFSIEEASRRAQMRSEMYTVP